MAWIYLAESAESQKPWNPGCEQSPIVNRTDTLRPFCFHAWPEGRLELPLSGTMCEPHGRTCSPRWTSLSEGFHARISALQAMEQGWRESEAVFSTKSSDYLGRLEPRTFSWKTSQLLLLEADYESLRSLPPWGMTVDGCLYQPRKQVRRTSANAGFLWPTPTASDFRGGRTKEAAQRVGRSPTNNLRDFLRQKFGMKRPHPNLLEALMGYPVSTTEITPWAMEWFRSKSGKLSKSSAAWSKK